MAIEIHEFVGSKPQQIKKTGSAKKIAKTKTCKKSKKNK